MFLNKVGGKLATIVGFEEERERERDRERERLTQLRKLTQPSFKLPI